MLLSRANVDQKALLSYAREAADFSTNHQLPKLDFAINHYGQPDVAMFDFTCMYASENAALFRQRSGHKLLVALVGDSLLEVSGKPMWRREIRLCSWTGVCYMLKPTLIEPDGVFPCSTAKLDFALLQCLPLTNLIFWKYVFSHKSKTTTSEAVVMKALS